MATISLTDPVAGTIATAGQQAGNNAALRTAINGGLDNTNIAGGAAIDLSKLAAAAWTAYTPTWTSAGTPPAIGNGTLQGRYVQIGKTVFYVAIMTVGTTTTFGSANTWTISVPVAAGGFVVPSGIIRANDSGTAYAGVAQVSTSTTVLLAHANASGALQGWISTIPFTWGTGDFFQVTGFYEAA